MSKLTIVNVADLWQSLSQPSANIAELLADIDDMDMAGFQLIHRLVCEKRVALSQLNANIAQTLKMMGCEENFSIPTTPVSVSTEAPERVAAEQKASGEISTVSHREDMPEITEAEITEAEIAIEAPEVPEAPEVANEQEAEDIGTLIEAEPETLPTDTVTAEDLTEQPTTQVVHDLSWKEIRKTIMTMNLAVAQIDLSMTEGEYSVDTLIDSFSFMNSEIDRINTMLQGEQIDLDQIRNTLTLQSQDLTEKADASIVAFQFYDKLTQRLHHVSQSLSALTDIISCGDCVVDDANWDKFMDRMSKYACMREESELFELIFERGYAATTAVEMIKEILSNRMQAAREKHKQDAPNFEDDIELF